MRVSGGTHVTLAIDCVAGSLTGEGGVYPMPAIHAAVKRSIVFVTGVTAKPVLAFGGQGLGRLYGSQRNRLRCGLRCTRCMETLWWGLLGVCFRAALWGLIQGLEMALHHISAIPIPGTGYPKASPTNWATTTADKAPWNLITP